MSSDRKDMLKATIKLEAPSPMDKDVKRQFTPVRVIKRELIYGTPPRSALDVKKKKPKVEKVTPIHKIKKRLSDIRLNSMKQQQSSDELEDGEISSDDSIGDMNDRPICRHYMRNRCFHGSFCYFRHPANSNDRGNYVMFTPLVLPLQPLRLIYDEPLPRSAGQHDLSFNSNLRELRDMMLEAGYKIGKPKRRLAHTSTPYKTRAVAHSIRISRSRSRSSSWSNCSSTSTEYASTTSSSSGHSRSVTPINTGRRIHMEHVLRAPRKRRLVSSNQDSPSHDSSTHSSKRSSSSSIELRGNNIQHNQYSSRRNGGSNEYPLRRGFKRELSLVSQIKKLEDEIAKKKRRIQNKERNFKY